MIYERTCADAISHVTISIFLRPTTMISETFIDFDFEFEFFFALAEKFTNFN